MHSVQTPYVLFLGEAGAPDHPVSVKTAEGVFFWRSAQCVSQYRLDGAMADLGLPDMSFEQAVKAGAKTLLIGIANRGGVLSPSWLPHLTAALEAGLDLASGLHQRLTDHDVLVETAKANGRTLHDVRHWSGGALPIGDGRKRSGKRALMIGTDCSVGKNFTALALEKELIRRGEKATCRATGQTGILITGQGVAIDAVPADFVSGAVEMITPDNDADHWDIVEGQASVLHPSFSAVTTGLVHGSQPDVMVLCHAAGREHLTGLPDRPLPSLVETIQAHLSVARVTNRDVRAVAVSLNTSTLNQDEAKAAITAASVQTGLPATDPIRFGAGVLADAVLGG